MLKRLLLPPVLWLACCGASAVGAGPTDVQAGAAEAEVKISGTDLAVIVAYLVGIVALGCWAGVRRKEAKGSDYFLAGRSLTWPMIGLALFATNISTIHLVSFAQNGYTSGLTYGNFEWMAAFTLVILSLFFAPFYLRSNVATLPDFMEKRFSRGSRDYLAILSIFSAIVVHIGFSLHTGAIVLEGTVLQSLGIPQPEKYHGLTILAMCGITAIYTIVGGLLAVVLTESIQTIVLLAGSFCITWIGFQMIGGWSELKASVHPVNLSMLRAGNDPTGITWYAVFLGYPVLGVWYWCTDQTIVQRLLGAKNENHARIGPLFAGFIKILPVFLFVLPGVICLGLINKGVAHGGIPPLPVRPDGTPMTERAYTHMIKTMLWPGMQGVVIAAMLAALMSTVSGALNSIATLCSYDIYQRFKPGADDRHLVRVGRIATFAAMCVAVLWSMGIGKLGETIFQAMVDVFPVVAPPTAAVFLWGVFWRRTSARAALWTLIGGSVLGLIIYALKTLDSFGVIQLDRISPRLASFLAVNSLFMAFILFVAESALIFLVSLLRPHRHTAESEALVWRSPLDALRGETAWRGLLDFRVMALLLVLTMVGLYWGFSSSETYYPIAGKVTLDGKPALGVKVILDTTDERLDGELLTGVDGTYHFATPQLAGGAPAGTKYRIRIVPAWDFLVRLKKGQPGQLEEVLASMPAGAQIEQRVVGGKKVFVLSTQPKQTTVVVDADTPVALWRAAAVPDRYRSFQTSGLDCVVKAGENHVDLPLKTAGAQASG
jgi:SSS family solute:Na+ symporter